MPTVAKARLKSILTAVRSRLVERTGVPEERILLCRSRRRIPKFQGDTDLVLQLSGPQSHEGFHQGAGRYFPVVSRVLVVRVRSRLGLDLSDRDESWLTDDDLGQWAIEDLALDALDLFMPDDGADVLLVEPMRLAQGSEPPEEDGRDKQWGETRLHFEILYALAIPTSVE